MLISARSGRPLSAGHASARRQPPPFTGAKTPMVIMTMIIEDARLLDRVTDQSVSVAEAKRALSELLRRVAHGARRCSSRRGPASGRVRCRGGRDRLGDAWPAVMRGRPARTKNRREARPARSPIADAIRPGRRSRRRRWRRRDPREPQEEAPRWPAAGPEAPPLSTAKKRQAHKPQAPTSQAPR